MKVKIFRSTDRACDSNFENEINEWLADPKKSIQQILQSEAMGMDGGALEKSLTVSIWYYQLHNGRLE